MNKAQAKAAWDKALSNGGSLDITFKTESEANTFRILLYRARKEFRTEVFEVLHQAECEYDAMIVSMAGNKLEIRPTVTQKIIYTDPKTGEEL